MLFRCPTNPITADNTPHTIMGCGRHFDAEPDSEQLVDCPHCGIFFGADNPDAKPDPEVINQVINLITTGADAKTQAKLVADMLNVAFSRDPAAMQALLVNRVPCNLSLVEDEHVVVEQVPVLAGSHYTVSAIGLVNAVLSVLNLPIITARFESGKLTGFQTLAEVVQAEAAAMGTMLDKDQLAVEPCTRSRPSSRYHPQLRVYGKDIEQMVTDAHAFANQRQDEGWTREDAAANLKAMLESPTGVYDESRQAGATGTSGEATGVPGPAGSPG